LFFKFSMWLFLLHWISFTCILLFFVFHFFVFTHLLDFLVLVGFSKYICFLFWNFCLHRGWGRVWVRISMVYSIYNIYVFIYKDCQFSVRYKKLQDLLGILQDSNTYMWTLPIWWILFLFRFWFSILLS